MKKFFIAFILFIGIRIIKADMLYPKIEIDSIRSQSGMSTISTDAGIIVLNKDIDSKNRNTEKSYSIATQVNYEGLTKQKNILSSKEFCNDDYLFVGGAETETGFIVITHQYVEQSGYFVVSVLDHEFNKISTINLIGKAILDSVFNENGVLLVGSIYNDEFIFPYAVFVNNAGEIEWEIKDTENIDSRFSLCDKTEYGFQVIQEKNIPVKTQSRYECINLDKEGYELTRFQLEENMDSNASKEKTEMKILNFCSTSNGIYIIVGLKKNEKPCGMKILCYKNEGEVLWEIENNEYYPIYDLIAVSNNDMVFVAKNLKDTGYYCYVLCDLQGEGVEYRNQKTTTWFNSASLFKNSRNELWFFGSEYRGKCFINRIE